MSRTRRILPAIGLAALLVLLHAGYRIGFGQPFTINQLANRQALLWLLDDPELLTQIGILDGGVLDRHSGRLTPVGVARRDAQYAEFERDLAEVRRFDPASLHGQDRITYEVLLDYYGSRLAMRRFPWLSSEPLYPIAPLWGVQSTLPSFLLSSHVVRNARSARHYVARLEAGGAKLDAATAEMQRQASLGVVLPLALLERSEADIRGLTAAAPESHPLVAHLDERMRAAGLDAQTSAQLHEAAVAAVRTSIYPAYARMSAALESLRQRAQTQSDGVGRLPDGHAFYAAMLREWTTTDWSAERLHALGLAEVERITREMDERLRAMGRKEGTVGERMTGLRTDPAFLLPNDAAGRREMIRRFERILEEVNARMPAYFPQVPREHLAVQRIPPTEEASSATHYQSAAMDGSREAVFYANLRNTAETPTWAMKTLAYHEGIPGHHFQIASAMRLAGLPMIRKLPVYSAYTEGWALYAERLAAEIGMYRDDPYGDLGRLQAELFRSVRLVVDTGLHEKGWSREQAIRYMTDTLGMHQDEVVLEVERYMGLPGQACAYKVGQLKILELRERARAALGARFDLKAFHGVVLGNGALPLTELERVVNDWIATERARR